MQWMDGHCDVLSKIWENPQAHSFYDSRSQLDVTYPHLREAQVALQIFAIFVPPEVPVGERFHAALQQVDHFYEKVIQNEEKMFPVLSGEQLSECTPDRIGGLLALEGADALQGEISNLRTFYRLGVRQMGLTWNYANEVADGIEEERGGGLTTFGVQVVDEMKRLGIILDVSHLSIKGFWEVIDMPGLPVVASHSNCLSLCSHKRNLADDQISALIQKDGLIGITFVPAFVDERGTDVTIDHLLRHVEHVCELGGENQLCFGSDFDGITSKIKDLENTSQINHLKNALLKRYPERLVQKWGWENACQFYFTHLSFKNGKKIEAN